MTHQPIQQTLNFLSYRDLQRKQSSAAAEEVDRSRQRRATETPGERRGLNRLKDLSVNEIAQFENPLSIGRLKALDSALL